MRTFINSSPIAVVAGVLSVFVGQTLYPGSAAALSTAGSPIVLAAGNARCNTDPDAVWFGGEFVIVYGSRGCPANANDATVMMTRYRPGAMLSPASAVVNVRLATEAIGRVSVRGNILRTVVGHRQLGGWLLRTEETNNLGVMTEQSRFSFPPAQAFDRMGLDCSDAGCTVATRHGVDGGGFQVGMLSENLAVFTPLVTAPVYAEISALQVGAQANVVFTVGAGNPRFYRFSPPNPLAAFAPLGMGPAGLSIVSTRYQGGIATL